MGNKLLTKLTGNPAKIKCSKFSTCKSRCHKK